MSLLFVADFPAQIDLVDFPPYSVEDFLPPLPEHFISQSDFHFRLIIFIATEKVVVAITCWYTCPVTQSSWYQQQPSCSPLLIFTSLLICLHSRLPVKGTLSRIEPIWGPEKFFLSVKHY